MKNNVKALPNQSKLREDFTYNPETGDLTRYDGYTGCLYKTAIVFVYESVHYYAHRLIYKLVTGDDPDQIDHINGDPWDNRWENLRNTTQATNVRNKTMGRNNKSGYTGVDYHTKRQLWRARVGYKHESKDLGYFNCPTAAYVTRLAWIRKHLPHEFTKRHLTSRG